MKCIHFTGLPDELPVFEYEGKLDTSQIPPSDQSHSDQSINIEGDSSNIDTSMADTSMAIDTDMDEV